MTMRIRSAALHWIGAGIAAVALAAGATAYAADGVIEINQTRMEAGGVTPGDTPGPPATITQPGSYRLTSDLVLTSINQSGVLVNTALGVTLDLNGFAIRGPFVCAPLSCVLQGGGYGVLLGAPPAGDAVTVRNGRITGMSLAGILLGAEARIENVDVSSCGEGIVVGARSHVVGNRVLRTRDRGLRFTGTSALFERNVLAQTGLGGVLGQTASVEGGTATGGNVCEDGLCRANLSRRRYYLTRTNHASTGAPTACDAGFHFASYWELHDPSGLQYDLARGINNSPQGFGPPSGSIAYPSSQGWVRTGANTDAGTGSPAGEASCTFWRTTEPQYLGTVITLGNDWTAASTAASPWVAARLSCSGSRHVWCVED